jgi:dolichyl-phosphate beta-glucosyltransferase
VYPGADLPADQHAHTPRLSVVVPAFNERGVIAMTVWRLRNELSPVDPDLEVVIADDGSSDGTQEAAEAAGADLVLRLPHLGKGAAVRAGMAVASGRTIAFVDADLAYCPVQLVGLLEAVEAGAAVAVGSRRHSNSAVLVQPTAGRRVASAGFAALTRALHLNGISDTQAGIKAFSSDAARAIFHRAQVDGFAFDVEIFVIARALGLTVVEVPVQLRATPHSSVHVGRHAGEMMRDLLRIRARAHRGEYQ